jgi:predicted deacylase
MIMDASDVMSKGTLLATITDPFGAFERKVNAPNDGYIINANLSPIVYQGMLYHISKTIRDGK